MGNPIVHFEIHGNDLEGLKTFYAGLFGWQIEAIQMPGGAYGTVDTAAGGKGINGGLTASSMAPGTVVYAEVDDVQAYLDRAVAAGAKVVTPVTEIPDIVTFAVFADPQGTPFGLVQSV